MNQRIFSVQHHRHGLAKVERAYLYAPLLTEALRNLLGVDGVVKLRTCNRVELILDAPEITTPDGVGRVGVRLRNG